MPVSQAYQGIADTVFSGLKGEHPAPKPGAIPTSLYPDIQFLPLYHGGEENQRFSCLWSNMWSKPLLCRFQQLGKIPQTQVSQGFAVFRLAPSRIPPRHSQTRRDTNFAIPGYSLFCHDTTASGKNKDFSVCGHSCGQRRFCAVFGNWGKSSKRRCYKALRRFALPCSGYRHGTPKAGALPTALHPVIKLNYPAGRILPKQARYQLRYTQILLILE